MSKKQEPLNEHVIRSSQIENKYFVAIICNQDAMIGFLLCGFAQTIRGENNFLIIDNNVKDEDIDSFFWRTYNRPDICMIIICTSVVHRIAKTLKKCQRHMPIVFQVPLDIGYEQISLKHKSN